MTQPKNQEAGDLQGMKQTYWKVVIRIAYGVVWSRSFGFKPTTENILTALYLEWNEGEPGSKLCRDLRLFITVADHVPAEFSDDSGHRLIVEIKNTRVGLIHMQKEEMYTR